MTNLWAALLVVAILGWWWLSMRAREAAIGAARQGCRRFDVQLLDETVALRRLRPARGADGRVRLWRLYRFEFTRTGGERHGGHVALLGRQLMDVHLDAVNTDDTTARDRIA